MPCKVVLTIKNNSFENIKKRWFDIKYILRTKIKKEVKIDDIIQVENTNVEWEIIMDDLCHTNFELSKG